MDVSHTALLDHQLGIDLTKDYDSVTIVNCDSPKLHILHEP